MIDFRLCFRSDNRTTSTRQFPIDDLRFSRYFVAIRALPCEFFSLAFYLNKHSHTCTSTSNKKNRKLASLLEWQMSHFTMTVHSLIFNSLKIIISWCHCSAITDARLEYTFGTIESSFGILSAVADNIVWKCEGKPKNRRMIDLLRIFFFRWHFVLDYSVNPLSIVRPHGEDN